MLEQLEAAAVKCAATPAWPLSDADITDCLDIAHRLQQQTTATLLHLVRAADTRGLAHQHGCRTTAGWLRSRLHLDPHAARTLIDQAAALDRHDAIDQALSCGAVNLAQATAITCALDDLTPEVDTATTGQARTTLLGWAGQLEAAQLRKLGTRILAHVAPDIADRHDQAALARDEQRTHRQRGFTLGLPTAGAVRVSGTLTVEDAATVHAALDPLCTPQAGDTRTPAQQRADALIDICRLALRTAELPDNGGEPPQVTVTVAFDTLTTGLSHARPGPGHAGPGHASPGPGHASPGHARPSPGHASPSPGHASLDTGEQLTPEAARRLACDARILPVVLGGPGQILDAGRNRRTATGPLRRALTLRDGGCTFPACDRPPRWCDSHHIKHWADGGPTDLDNLVLLCGQHHRQIHQGDWTVQLGTDRLPQFLPPAYIDHTRRPRRNIFHRRT